MFEIENNSFAKEKRLSKVVALRCYRCVVICNAIPSSRLILLLIVALLLRYCVLLVNFYFF